VSNLVPHEIDEEVSGNAMYVNSRWALERVRVLLHRIEINEPFGVGHSLRSNIFESS